MSTPFEPAGNVPGWTSQSPHYVPEPAVEPPIVAPELLTSTGSAGYALVNAGTTTILSWTAPNDGNMHRVLLFGTMYVSSAETGGVIQIEYTDPGGNTIFAQVFAGSQTAGGTPETGKPIVIQSGSTVYVKQTTALTAGAATLWAELWGS